MERITSDVRLIEVRDVRGSQDLLDAGLLIAYEVAEQYGVLSPHARKELGPQVEALRARHAAGGK